MRSIDVALALVLAAGSSAHADEGPIVVRAGLGITADSHDSDYPPQKLGPGIHADIAYRFARQLAAGVHFGMTRNGHTYSVCDISCDTDPYGYYIHAVETPILLGVTAYWSARRFWLAPWVGIDDRSDSENSRPLAFGLGAGVDLYIAPTGHRVGVYFDISRGLSIEQRSDGRTYESAGIAYRYW